MRKILLDTNALIWMHVWPEKLPAAWRPILSSAENALFASDISLWEIGIKQAKFGSRFGIDPELIVDCCRETDIDALNINRDVLIASTRLKMHHRDPFDRYLIAQAVELDAEIMTTDRLFAKYDVDLIDY